MNKKGVEERLYLWTFYLVLAIILFGVLFAHISDVAKGEDFAKDYLARDVALLINTLYASPGDIFVEYPLKKELYSISVGKIEGKYKVKVNTVEKGIPVEYPYAEDLFSDISLEETFGERYSVNSILFEKKGEEVFVEEKEPVTVKPIPKKPIIEEKKFIWPVKEEPVVTSCYGERRGEKDIHEGIDIRTCDFDEKGRCVNYNKPIRAVADGKVKDVLFGDEYWNTINIEHRGYVTRYLHLESPNPNMKVGHDVKRGDVIGVAGDHVPKGKPEVPPHLHFAIFINGEPVDPLNPPGSLPSFDLSKIKFTEDSNCYYNKGEYAYWRIIKENVIKEEEVV